MRDTKATYSHNSKIKTFENLINMSFSSAIGKMYGNKTQDMLELFFCVS